jgi:Fic family protein
MSSDEQQAAGYYEGLNRVLSLTKETSLTEDHIKELHSILLMHSKKDSWHAGKYKVSANNLVLSNQDASSTTKTLQTASPADTPTRMAELLKWYQEEKEAGQINPLILVAIFIATFLEIRPFQDGNGRISHLLTRLLLLKTGYHFVVYGSLEGVVELSRADYYEALTGIHASLNAGSPDWQPWLVYFLEVVVEQVRRLSLKLEREKQIFSALPKLSSAIVELARDHGRVTMADAIKLTGSNRNTLKQHFRKLVFQGQLARHGMGAGVWYQAR